MSNFHRTNKEWEGFIINDITVIKKIGEKPFKTGKYEYIDDILLVKCKCSYEYEKSAKSLICSKPKGCRRCATKKVNNIGKTISNLECFEQYHKHSKSGRSVIWLKTKCLTCNCIHNVKADVFNIGEASCPNCRMGNKFLSNYSKRIKNSKRLLSSIKSRCKKRNYYLDPKINEAYLDNLIKNQNYKCKLSGVSIQITDGTASLDRIDNSQGYIIGNLQFIYRPINYMKNELDQNEFIKLCSLVSCYTQK